MFHFDEIRLMSRIYWVCRFDKDMHPKNFTFSMSELVAFENAVKSLKYLIDQDGEAPKQSSVVTACFGDVCAVDLHGHQIDGIEWMMNRWRSKCSIIVADEMGLGKTLQTLAFMAHLKSLNLATGPFLVIAPSSVAPQWTRQANDFVPSLRVLEYMGSQDVREEQRRSLIEDHIMKLPQQVIDSGDPQPLPFDVMVSTYETVLSDIDFIDKFRWRVTVYDEGHRLKNSNSVTHKTFLSRLRSPVSQFQIILTGTPVQNNFSEFWSLVHFLHPSVFTEKTKPTSDPPPMTSIHDLVDLLVLRRLFSSMKTLKLPQMKQLLIKTEMTKIQSDLYKWALVQYAQQSSTSAPTNLLTNLMMTLRKISNHPYLIPGVEPEPFQEGPHIWHNSNKLMILKLLLEKMKSENSRCLIFSNFTSFLDIVQDFLDLENIPYERLDGSIRGEDRTGAISRFDEKTASVFLLSTRAGGVGLNLASANWVIFLDTDWNPQMDLQAIARAHRQGQTKQVSVYRLVSANSIDELIFNRSISKIKLSKSILSESVREEEKIDVKEMKNFIAFGANTLTPDISIDMPKAVHSDLVSLPPNIESLIQSLDAPCLVPTPTVSADDEAELVIVSDYKTFEGINYSSDLSLSANHSDLAAIDALMQRAAKLPIPPKPLSIQRDRFAPVSEAERAELRRITEENRKRRKIDKWTDMGYQSCSIPIADLTNDCDATIPGTLTHLHGSVVEPQTTSGKTPIIVQLIDSSGVWPDTGRLFKSIASAFPMVPRQYARAKQAQDLHLGEVHVIAEKKFQIALVICHRNDDFEILKKSLFSLTVKFQNEPVDFHFPRIGDKRGNLYITERIIKRYVCDRGFDAYVYYYKAHNRASTPPIVDQQAPSPNQERKKISLMDYFKVVTRGKTPVIASTVGQLQVWISPDISPVLAREYKREIEKYLRGAKVIDGATLSQGLSMGANVFVVSALKGKNGLDECILGLEQLGVSLDSIEVSIPTNQRPPQDAGLVVMTSEHLERMIQNSNRK